MKNCIYWILILGLTILVSSCMNDPLPTPMRTWLCSINADGTGFQRIHKAPSITPGLVDIYMTKDDRIIFYGEKLWISDTDTLSITPITPKNLVMFNKPQLEFTRDGETAYFAASRDLYQMSMETYEFFKITETPVDFSYAEPVLSDDERYLTMRGYNGKSNEPRIASAYIDLLDYSSGYIYANTWFPMAYQTKIMNGLSKLFVENRDGFASVSLVDSTYTLHLPYPADWSDPFETSADKRYILTRDRQPPSHYAMAIDLNDFTQYELGLINRYSDGKPIKACKDVNIVFFFDDDHIYKYDLDTHEKSTVFDPGSSIYVKSIDMIAPTWDGSKVYFYAFLSDRRGI